MKGHYAYPPDEFDAAAQEERPRGVHRAPRSWWSRWGALVAVVVIFPLLAFGAVTWLSSWQGTQDDEPIAGAPLDDEPEATEPAEPTEPEGTDEEPVEETPTEEPTPEEPALPEPDLTASVIVLNATNTSGLASGGAARLQEAGFTTVTSGNWQGQDPPASVVYYADAADEGTAAEVATALGITAVEQSDDVDRVTAVLWTDYQPQ
ncbi:MAG: LytR C-terminal domain-containing protein [Actinotalea sp.]|nr:LytR C-terminal domain-containing protein [Actinotalea sp.]